MIAMSAWLGANRSANSRTERKRWKLGDDGSWVAATNASSASGFFTLRTSDTVMVCVGAVGPRSPLVAAAGRARGAGAAPTGGGQRVASATAAEANGDDHTIRRNVDDMQGSLARGVPRISVSRARRKMTMIVTLRLAVCVLFSTWG